MNAWSGDPVPEQLLRGTTALERQGALVFQAKQCRNCHALGEGGGERGPRLDGVAVRLTQDQLIRQVIQGGGNMPAYGKNLSPAETTALVAFLVTLHPPDQTPAREAARDVALDAGRNARDGRNDSGLRLPGARVPAWMASLPRPSPQAIGAWRAASFLLGLFLMWIAVASPLASGDAHSLTVHMVQHLLLMTFAPPFIWLAEPVRLLLCVAVLAQGISRSSDCSVAAGPAAWKAARSSRRVLDGRDDSAGRLARARLAHAGHAIGGVARDRTRVFPRRRAPFLVAGRSALADSVYGAAMVDGAVPVSGDAAVRHPVGIPRVLGTIAYPVYLSAPRHVSVSVLDDQQRAGALMWTAVTIMYLVAGVIVTTRSLSRLDVRIDSDQHRRLPYDLRTGLFSCHDAPGVQRPRCRLFDLDQTRGLPVDSHGAARRFLAS